MDQYLTRLIYLQQEAEELDDDAQYLKRLSGGLFTLQLIDRIILEVCIILQVFLWHFVPNLITL